MSRVPLWLFEQQDELVIQLNDAVRRIRERTHDDGSACCPHCRLLPPNDGAHVIKADAFTLGNDFRMDRDDLVATIDDRTGKLVADVDAEPPSWFEHSPAFAPDTAQIQQVFVKRLPIADLPFHPIVLDVPVGWRSHNQMNTFIRHFRHVPAVSDVNQPSRLHRLSPSVGFCRIDALCQKSLRAVSSGTLGKGKTLRAFQTSLISESDLRLDGDPNWLPHECPDGITTLWRDCSAFRQSLDVGDTQPN